MQCPFHPAGPVSIPGRVSFLIEVFPGFLLNCMTKSGNFGNICPWISFGHRFHLKSYSSINRWSLALVIGYGGCPVFPASTTGSNLFGNQQNANTGLFGNTGTSAFGGASKPAFGSFGSSTGLFGQQQQTQPVQPAPSLFGQSSGTGNTGTGIFGAAGYYLDAKYYL